MRSCNTHCFVLYLLHSQAGVILRNVTSSNMVECTVLHGYACVILSNVTSSNRIEALYCTPLLSFCIRYFSNTKHISAKKHTGQCFSIKLQFTCKTSDKSEKNKKRPKIRHRLVIFSGLQLFSKPSLMNMCFQHGSGGGYSWDTW